MGGFDHLKPLMILQRAGVMDVTAIKYIGLDGGADAITQTVGGFTQADKVYTQLFSNVTADQIVSATFARCALHLAR